MSEQVKLTSRVDGFTLNGHLVRPNVEPIGGVVVIQEIFGVSPHIEEMCAVFADAGYTALAPSLFDRIEAASTPRTIRPASSGASPR